MMENSDVIEETEKSLESLINEYASEKIKNNFLKFELSIKNSIKDKMFKITEKEMQENLFTEENVAQIRKDKEKLQTLFERYKYRKQ